MNYEHRALFEVTCDIQFTSFRLTFLYLLARLCRGSAPGDHSCTIDSNDFIQAYECILRVL